MAEFIITLRFYIINEVWVVNPHLLFSSSSLNP